MLNRKIEVIVPSDQKDGTRISQSIRLQALVSIKHILAEGCGGYSSYVQTGGWVHEDGSLQEEVSENVHAYTSEDKQSHVHNMVVSWAKEYKELLNQDAIAVITNGAMYFI